MSEALQTVIDFVEGQLNARQLEATLYSRLSEFEQLLNQDPNIPVHSYAAPSVFLFIIKQDFGDPGDVLSIHGALSDYLQRNGIANDPTSIYGDFYELLLQAQPGWLFAETKYLSDLVGSSEGRTGEELKQWLHAELLKQFCYLSSPPDWIQDPAVWPMGDDGPLFFLGQIAVEGYFHDVAAAYVFHDQKSGTCETIIQVS